jgi:Cu(I)/Ag(I) efflux system periplasmic protein CusF
MNSQETTMKSLKSLFTLTLASLLTAAGSALAQNQSDEHATHHPTPSTTGDAAASKDMTEGEVRRVDLATKKIILKHGEIKNLGMGAMTMVFQVNDPALLSQVKAGDKVRFRVEQIKGAFVVMSIEKVAP